MSRRIEVAFDTAGGHRAGVGHVVRALAVAEYARQLGARVTLLDPGRLPIVGSGPLPPRARRPDVVAVDRPDTTADLLRRRRERWPDARLVALDYYGEPVAGLAAVVNLNEARERRGARDVGRYYRGLEYATIRRSFRERRGRQRTVPSKARRILVGFGGTDPHEWTAAAVDTLLASVPAGPSIHVLTGRPLVRAWSDARVRVHVGVPDPSALLQASDIAVIGGGTMMIEAACLGVPALVIPRTPEERGFTRQFEAAGAVRVVPAASRFPARRLARACAELVDDRVARSSMRAAGRRLVDGRGGERVARLIVRAGASAA